MILFMHDEMFEKYSKLEEKKLNFDKKIEIKSTENENIGYTEDGSTAYINVKGILQKKRDNFLDYFGVEQTAYVDIANQIKKANNNSNIKDIILVCNSGGGNVEGLFETANIIKNSKKTVTAHIENYACSAAYALISQAKEIIAKNEYCTIGSIGVVVTHRLNKNLIDITSTNAYKKRPDPETEEGKNFIKEELDEWEDKFYNLIVQGRGHDKAYIKANYGNGATFLSEKAKSLQIIDKIGYNILNKNLMENNMDLIKLKAEHPELYAQVKLEGKNEEKSRVKAHTIAAETGDLNYALECIKTGVEFGAVQQATHMSFFQKSLMEKVGEKELKKMEDENVEKIDAKVEVKAETITAMDAEMLKTIELENKAIEGDL